MRIAVVEPRGVGGMIHYAYRLCAALSREGADVVLVTSRDYELRDHPHHFRVEPILRPTSRPAGLPPGRRAGVLASVRWRTRRMVRLTTATGVLMSEWLRLIRRLRAVAPDVVQFGSIEHAIEGPFLAYLRLQGMALAAIVHEPEVRGRTGVGASADVALYRLLYRSFAVLALHGRANRSRFRELYPGIPEARLISIEHGNVLLEPPPGGRHGYGDTREVYGLPAGSPVVLFFGTLLPNKGIDDLLRAFALVAPRRPDARLLVVGPPSKHIDVEALTELACELGIGPSTTIDARYVPIGEVPQIMRTASVVVFPYHDATQSGALQVAYAHGRPVIATRVGGLPEVVEHGGSGLLVAPRAPQELATAICLVLDDPEGANRMGRRAKELSETKHSWDAVARELLAAYGPLVGAPTPRSRANRLTRLAAGLARRFARLANRTA